MGENNNFNILTNQGNFNFANLDCNKNIDSSQNFQNFAENPTEINSVKGKSILKNSKKPQLDKKYGSY